MMDIHALVMRSRQLRADIEQLAKLSSHDKILGSSELLERCDKTLKELEHFSEGTHHQYTWLLQQVWDICGVLTRDSTGHAWKRDLPDKTAASEFYQKFLALVRWLKNMN
jgi:hypothetical protein